MVLKDTKKTRLCHVKEASRNPGVGDFLDNLDLQLHLWALNRGSITLGTSRARVGLQGILDR